MDPTCVVSEANGVAPVFLPVNPSVSSTLLGGHQRLASPSANACGGGRFWRLAVSGSEDESSAEKGEIDADAETPECIKYMVSPLERECRTPEAVSTSSLASSRSRMERRMAKRQHQRNSVLSLLSVDVAGTPGRRMRAPRLLVISDSAYASRRMKMLKIPVLPTSFFTDEEGAGEWIKVCRRRRSAVSKVSAPELRSTNLVSSFKIQNGKKDGVRWVSARPGPTCMKAHQEGWGRYRMKGFLLPVTLIRLEFVFDVFSVSFGPVFFLLPLRTAALLQWRTVAAEVVIRVAAVVCRRGGEVSRERGAAPLTWVA